MPKGVPTEWSKAFTNFEEVTEQDFGRQMSGGWFATRWGDGKDVFIKQYRVDQHPAASYEVDVLQALDGKHSNVNALLDHADCRGHMLTVTEKLESGNLFEHISNTIDNGKTYSEKEVQTIAKELVAGTKFLHENGVAHRDLNPENVMGNPGASICLVDFGSAIFVNDIKLTRGSSAALRAFNGRTDGGGVMRRAETRRPGAVPRGCWCSPEQDKGEEEQNPFLSDVYALGCLLFTMMRGEMPGFKCGGTTLDCSRSGWPCHGACGPNTYHGGPEFFDHTLSHVADTDLSPLAKDLILRMTRYQDDRCDIHQVADHPWLQAELSANALPEGVVNGLLKLSLSKTVNGVPGDYYCREVGTEGTHITSHRTMGRLYDMDKPMDIRKLPAAELAVMPSWQEADRAGMCWYRATSERSLIPIGQNAMNQIQGHFSSSVFELRASSSLQRIQTESGDVALQASRHTQLPSADEVFQFVHEKVGKTDADFRVWQFKKRGVFARRMETGKACDKKVVISRTRDKHSSTARYFIYESPFSRKTAHGILKLTVGDAFAYKPKRDPPCVYTIEQEALEHNHEAVDQGLYEAWLSSLPYGTTSELQADTPASPGVKYNEQTERQPHRMCSVETVKESCSVS